MKVLSVIVLVVLIVFSYLWFFEPQVFNRKDKNGFPLNPKVGDLVTINNSNYRWDGKVWVTVLPLSK